MARIERTETGESQLLEPEHLVGRGAGCSLRIREQYVSTRHAVLRWAGENWELRDLGSRNGTFLNGERIPVGEDCLLSPGSKLTFGKSEQEWTLCDVAAPEVMVVPLEGGPPLVIEGDLLAVPTDEEPRGTVYRGPDGIWVLENADDTSRRVSNCETFEVDGHQYRFCCPIATKKTSLAGPQPLREITDAEVVFRASQDEEYVTLSVRVEPQCFDLGAHAQNYLLLTLARQRMADQAAGLADTSCGWVYHEDLSKGLKVPDTQVNVDVHRIRKRFASLPVSEPAKIIERRPRTRQLRIGCQRLVVETL